MMHWLIDSDTLSARLLRLAVSLLIGMALGYFVIHPLLIAPLTPLYIMR